MHRSTLLLVCALAACSSSKDDSKPDGGDGGDPCRDTSKSPPNLVSNFNMECGGAAQTQWAAVYGTLDIVAGEGRDGGRAARATVNALGARFTYVPDLVADGGFQTYCVTAWAKGTSPYMRIRVLRDSGGGGTSFDFNSPLFAAWSRIPPNITLLVPNENANRLILLFEAQTNRSDNMNAKVGDTLFIDDVDAWESPSGRCDEIR